MTTVEIFTDGACRGNPGPGGWGALLRCGTTEKQLYLDPPWQSPGYPLLRCGTTEKQLYGGAPDTTNNRMELMAAIKALEALNRPCEVVLTTDSQYVRQGITSWLAGWKRKGWKTAGRQPVKNRDLWQQLDQQAGRHRVDWRWVKGHSGHRENEVADQLANRGIDELLTRQ